MKASEHPLAALAQCHRDVIAALSADDKNGEAAAFANHDGTALADALEQLIDSPAAANLAVARGDYAELFEAAIGDRMVRRPESRELRAHIYGPLEARLQTVDRIVLGGLNEGTLAAGDAQRSVAEPPDAPRSRPRSARASHRPLRARLRAGIGRK